MRRRRCNPAEGNNCNSSLLLLRLVSYLIISKKNRRDVQQDQFTIFPSIFRAVILGGNDINDMKKEKIRRAYMSLVSNGCRKENHFFFRGANLFKRGIKT